MSTEMSRDNSSKSQFQEDLGVLQFFDNRCDGFFVEVGANDGKCGSNTYLLEQHGWRGILIEPSVTLAECCRRSRPGSVVINKAVVGDPGVVSVDFHEYSPSPSGARFDGMSSVGAPSPYEKTALAAGSQVKMSIVPAARLDDILAEIVNADRIDFLSIDVEGCELDVLKGLSIEKFRPRLIIVEDNSFGVQRDVPRYLSQFGYTAVYRSFVNVWYVTSSDIPFSVRLRYPISKYLEFKLDISSVGSLDVQSFHNEIWKMIVAEGKVLGPIKYLFFRSCPIWTLRISVSLLKAFRSLCPCAGAST